MNRREFLKYSVAGSLAWPMFSPQVWGQRVDSVPNVVLILADDMGYGDLACQNPDSKIPTPNLDRLAGEGMRFTDAHTASGVCSPTRYSVLTGRYHWRGRLKTGIVMPFGSPAVESDRLTIAGMLREKGYATGCVGKWHLGFEWPFKKPRRTLKKGEPYRSEDFDWSGRISRGPVDCGFDMYFGDDTPNFPPYTWIENDHVLKTPSAQFRTEWTSRAGI
jgi:arylsulfatase A